MMTPRALVCLPTYNERENLESILKELLATAPVDVLVIDDNSPDGTGRIADLLARDEPRIHVLHRAGKLGLGTAYIEGFRYALNAGYECVLEMDADFSHQPRYVPQLLAALDDADLSVGSRYVAGGGTENWGLYRRVLSKGGSLYARTILSLPIRDLTSGFKCFKREVLAAIDLDTVTTTGYAFQIEMTYRAIQAGFRVAEVPIVFYERTQGRSKMSGDIVIEGITKVWGLRFDRSIKAVAPPPR